MSGEGDRIRISEDSNRPGWHQRQTLLDRIIVENLGELNDIQGACDGLLLEDPRDRT